jgi:DNA polymerase elongation subunit (family B)
MEQKQVTPEAIEQFFDGHDPQKYITAIEANYYDETVSVIINQPNGYGTSTKIVKKEKYKPFLWMKEAALDDLYGGNRGKLKNEMRKAEIKVKLLKTKNDEGTEPQRLAAGYKYLITGSKNYLQLLNFFKDAGCEINGNKNFMTLPPIEQYMIQSGKRLFKGFDDYNDLHRLQFDLETTGLDPHNTHINQIGIKNNRGWETILTIEDGPNRLSREVQALETFFGIIDALKPDIIEGYNSETFDWYYIFERCRLLNVDITKMVKTLNPNVKIKRKQSTLKLGSDTEYYEQTYMWGYNIADIYHSVRRAQAINSDIKKAGLKYITKFSEINKPNRVYINDGRMIGTIWSDKVNEYAFNDVNGDWYKITENKPLKDEYEIVTGQYIAERYLLDDLWETEQVGFIFNQASFLLSKILPTSFMRTLTMGTATIWKLIMLAWSYENDLAIPEFDKKRDFTGGLSRLLRVGKAGKYSKLDYAALYPKTQLTWNIFSDIDISGVMKGLLTYIVDYRDKYKALMNEAYGLGDTKTGSFYDRKQLPLKILANSFFGSYGAPDVFPWSQMDLAEETTCRGRMYLRLMVKFFVEKYGFIPLVGDSVTYDTPVYIRYKNGMLDILPICDLFNENSNYIDSHKLRDFEAKPYEVLTVNGWKNIKYVFRHETEKTIHRITTKDRLVNVTEDHSLFQNNIQIKPSKLKRGDKIDVCNDLNDFNSINSISSDEAWLYGFFLGDGSANCSKRTQKYRSKKTGEIHINKGKRSDWKISNSNLEFLEKLKLILETKFKIKSEIKNHLKSSSVYNLVVHNATFATFFCENFYTSYREKKIPNIILNSNNDIKKYFLEGVCASDGYGNTIDTCSDIGMKSQVAMAGIGLLMKNLNIEYKIKTRKDKQNFISFSLKNNNRNLSSFTKKTLKKSDEVWKNEIISNKDINNFVYDISTDDGTFIGGIGLINLKNTDGFNFEIPLDIDNITYISNGKHSFNEKDKEYIGVKAVVAEFNDTYMIGRMGLDIDEIGESTINFARKNYANKIIKKGKTKIKLVGNTIKSKKMPTYIEEFLDEAIVLLLDNKGSEFIELYQKYVDMIYSYSIPLIKIASKSKVKISIDEYKKKCKKTNKAGKPMPKQAHMELAILHNLKVELGDVIYYVNTGEKKSHGDIKTEKGVVKLNCKLIPTEDIESDSNLTTEEYNVAKYLTAFNNRITPLLVVFKKEIRDKIFVETKTDRKTKKMTLAEPQIFTEEECILVSGIPDEPIDQDDYEKDLMNFEDKEIKFWLKVNKTPNNLEDIGVSLEDWEGIKADYLDRVAKMKEGDLIFERKKIDDLIKRLEANQLENINELLASDYDVAIDVINNYVNIAYLSVNEEGELIFLSKKYDEEIGKLDDIFKYEDEAITRAEFYETLNDDELKKPYDFWLKHLEQQKVLNESVLSVEPNQSINEEEKVIVEAIQEVAEITLNEDDDEWNF